MIVISKINKKALLFLLISCIMISVIFAVDAPSTTPTSLKDTINFSSIVNFFNSNWVKGLACLFLIGECLGLLISGGGQNPQIFKKFLPWIMGTILFMCAGKIVGIAISPSFKFGYAAMPQFTKITKYLDVPLAKGIGDFVGIMYNLENIVITFATVLCLLNIIFNSFKLWAGTQELKKVYVDVIYKSLLCIVIMQLYPTIQATCLQVAGNVGANVAGGKQKIENVFVTAFMKLRNDVQTAVEPFLNALAETGTFSGTDGTGKSTYVTDDVLKTLANDYYMTPEEIQKWMADHKLRRAEAVYTDVVTGLHKDDYMPFNESQLNKEQKFVEYRDALGNPIDQKGIDYDKTQKHQRTITKDSHAKIMRKSFVKIEALAEVLTGYSVSDRATWDEETKAKVLKDMMSKKIEDIFYNPYLSDDDGNQTNYISPSAILKTCWLMTDCVALAAQYKTEIQESKKPESDDKDEIGKEAFNPETEKQKFMEDGNFVWEGLRAMVTSLIYYLGMFICSIVVMCEYTICIWEYLIVTSIAILLIPLLFLDATKSFAQNILKIFLQYFAKIMVISIACFYTLGLYIDVITTTLTVGELSSMTSLGLYLLTLILGLTFATGSEKIANVVFTGSPQMSMGDIVRGVRDVGMVAGMAQKAAGAGMKLGGAAAHIGQGGVKGIMGLHAAHKGGQTASEEVGKQLRQAREDKQWNGSDKDIERLQRQAYRGTMGSALGQKVSEGFHKALTGQDKQYHNENGEAAINKKDAVAFQKNGETIAQGVKADHASQVDAANRVGTKVGSNVAARELATNGNKYNADKPGQHKTKP